MPEDLYPNPSKEDIEHFEDNLPRTNYGDYD